MEADRRQPITESGSSKQGSGNEGQDDESSSDEQEQTFFSKIGFFFGCGAGKDTAG